MDEKLALEMAYKNGYEQGVKDLAERLKEKSYTNNYCQEIVLASEIDTISEELLKERAKG